MGEFTVDAPVYDDKMGEPAPQKPYMQESVSFGRFENDSLAWEKWSTFSPNKYLEEVEKCATPGSVAQKKAYFEAHYKKIAAKKAQLLAQEGIIEKVSLRLDVQNCENLSNDNSTFDTTLDASNSQSSSEEVKQETDLTSEVNSAGMYNPVQDVAVTTECHNSTADDVEAEGEKKDIESGSDSRTRNHEEAVCVQRFETSIGKTEDNKELQADEDNVIPKVSEVKVQNAKLDRRKESKMHLAYKKRDAAKTKKVVSAMHKAPPISTQRVPRTHTPMKVVASGSSTKKGNSPMLSSSRSKYTPTAASKAVPHKSLDMSLNLSVSSPGSASPMAPMRKSFILEKMGDKDIVKRVFKTFQSNLNQTKYLAEDGSSVKKQLPTSGTEIRTSESMIGQKENGRRTKVHDLDKTGVTTVPSTFDLKSNPRTEKRKEKLVEKSNSKVAERESLLSKLQVGKSEIIKVRQSTNIKATTMPGSYQKQKLSQRQSTSDKGNLKTGIRRQVPKGEES